MEYKLYVHQFFKFQMEKIQYFHERTDNISCMHMHGAPNESQIWKWDDQMKEHTHGRTILKQALWSQQTTDELFLRKPTFDCYSIMVYKV